MAESAVVADSVISSLHHCQSSHFLPTFASLQPTDGPLH